MAITPLPPSNTPRYFIDYTSMDITHTVMLRFETPLEDVPSAFNQLLTAMIGCMRIADHLQGVRFAAQGSDVTFPVLIITSAGLLSNASAIGDDPESVFVSCPFRGVPSGRKGRQDFYFPTNAIPADVNNRFAWGTVPELVEVEEALTALADVGQEGNQLCDISGARIIYNGYWNRAKSAYWQRRQRTQ